MREPRRAAAVVELCNHFDLVRLESVGHGSGQASRRYFDEGDPQV
jgi:hypothetical protein